MQQRHAHWNCSNGASGHAMLAACFQALKNLSADTDVWLSELMELQRTWFGLVTVLIQPLVGGDSHQVVQFEVIKKKPGNSTVPANSATDGIPPPPPSLELDNHVQAMFNATIQELIRTRKRIHDETTLKNDVEAAKVSALFVVSVLWCLQRLDVQSISYSPVLLGTNASEAHRRNEHLLLGLSVIPVDSAETYFSECAVTLLRVSPTDSSASPQMKLLCLSHGLDNTRNVRVTLTIGTRSLPGTGMEGTTSIEGVRDAWKLDRMLLLQTNIDDMTPEHLQFCVERLLSAGASDVWTIPIGMKKGRAAQSLQCLCNEPLRDIILSLLFRHSSTLGVRLQAVDRASLYRRIVTVSTKWNDAPVDVKVAYMLNGDQEEIVSTKAEFDHCRTISLATNIPIQVIADEAVRLARAIINKKCQKLY